MPIAPARTGKREASAMQGYIIEQWDGKWEIKRGAYYNHILKRELPIVGSVKKEILAQTVIDCVLKNIEEE